MIKRNKITVFCPPGLDAFVSPIIDHMRQFYNINLFNSGNKYEFAEAMRHSDLIWFEWCLNHLTDATNFVKACKYLCRMHSFEAFTDHPAKVNWNLVDKLIIPNRSVLEVNSFFKSYMANRMNMKPEALPPFINPSIVEVVYNSVDIDKFKFNKNKNYSKRIAWVGAINFKKGFDNALHIFNEIRKHDKEFTFHIAGEFQEPRYQLYLENFMKDNGYESNRDIFYHGKIRNMSEFLFDMDYILSSSLYESFGVAIIEAMSCGVVPLIYNWYGSKYIYPDSIIFKNMDECLSIIKRMEDGELEDTRKMGRSFVESKYSNKIIYPQIKSILDHLLYGDLVIEKTNNLQSINVEGLAESLFLTKQEIKDIIGRIKRTGKYDATNNDNG